VEIDVNRLTTQGRHVQHRTLRTSFLVACLVLASFALLEISLRWIVGLGDPPLYDAHPTIEFLLRPGNYRRFGNRVTVNSAGMRSPEIAIAPKGPSELRILVIGDSIVNGGSLTDDDALATSILARQLGQVVPTTVCNVSAGSWSPGNWLAYIRERGTFGAAYAVIILNDGDATDSPTFAPLGPEHPTEKPTFATWEVLVTYLPRYVPFLRRSPSIAAGQVEPPPRPLDELAAGVELLRNAGVEVSAVLVPSETEVSSGLRDGLRRIQSRLGAAGVPSVDASDSIRDAIARGQQPFRDGVHLTEIGQVVLSGCCREALRLAGLDREHRPPTQAP
jgi:hypothetical protein